MDRKSVVLPTLIICFATIAQTFIFNWFPLIDIKPDLRMILLIYFSYRQGQFCGQISGFCSGLLEDILSTSPIGFNAFVKTLIGFLYGTLKGNFFINVILLPILLVTFGTLINILLSMAVNFVFLGSRITISVLRIETLYEIGVNIILAPVVFSILNATRAFKLKGREY